MKIALIKARTQEIPFEIEADSKKFSGFLKSTHQGLIKLDATLQGKLELQCDRCGNTFVDDMNETVQLLISEGSYEGIDKELDIIEVYDGVIDIDEILESEINLIKSDYHYCDNCQ